MDEILSQLLKADVDCVLIGGMNFLLKHLPELTFDVDIWVLDEPFNLARLNQALTALGAEWGPTEHSWAPIPENPGWLSRQPVFCLTTKHGALDVFREVRGLEGRYLECRNAASRLKTASGVEFWSLSDEHMLACQECLPEGERKPRRIEVLRAALSGKISSL